MIFSTFAGGSGGDASAGLALSESGEVYITGSTSSIDFPLVNSIQLHQGGSDAFVMKLDQKGGLTFSTCLGGSGDDLGIGIVLDTNQNVYVTGRTLSTDFPLTKPLQRDFGGSGPAGGDAFVVKIAEGNTMIFPHFANGSEGNFAVSSEILLANLNTQLPAHATLELTDQSGNPLSINLDGQIVNGRSTQIISPGGPFRTGSQQWAYGETGVSRRSVGCWQQ